MDLISAKDVSYRVGGRSKYIAPDIPLDKDMQINIKYGMLEVTADKSGYIPKRCGAYIITTKSGHQYIGSTKNLNRRLNSHIVEQRNNLSINILEPIEKICVYVTESIICAKILEYWLIKEFKPRLNIDK